MGPMGQQQNLGSFRSTLILLTFEKISKFQNWILRIPSRFIFDTESDKTLEYRFFGHLE